MLNAFRHQRDKHLLFFFYPVKPPHVLNAFRHQRDKHLHDLTTFGRQLRKVLNAFRHQRDKHLHFFLNPVKPTHVLNAFRHQRDKHIRTEVGLVRLINRAQRLPASEG